MNSKKTCFYCKEQYLNDSEHAFPDGLGGEKIYLNCVCQNCNNQFSSLERELYQKGMIALMRSVEGVSSYKQKNEKKFFKAFALLALDEKNEIVYEVNQNDKFLISLKSQILNIGREFYFEGSDQSDMDRFIKIFTAWRIESRKLVIPPTKNSKGSVAQFEINGKGILISEQELNINEKKAIVLELFQDHDLTKFLKPRIYFDHNKSLKLRATSKQQAMDFLEDLLIYTLKPVSLRSFSKELNANRTVYIIQNFDGLKSERALVKIAINCLLYYFPELQNETSLEQARLFVKEGSGNANRSLVPKSNLIDSKEKCHNIFFYQLADSLSIRISLFNGQFCYQIIIPKLKMFEYGNYARLTINYVNRKNHLENRNDFLESFNL